MVPYVIRQGDHLLRLGARLGFDPQKIFSKGGKPVANAACVVHGLPRPNELTTDGGGKLTFTAPVNLELVTVEFKQPHFVQRLKNRSPRPDRRAVGRLPAPDQPASSSCTRAAE